MVIKPFTILIVNKLTVVLKVGGWGNPPKGPPSGRDTEAGCSLAKSGMQLLPTQARQLPETLFMFFDSARLFISCRYCGDFFPFTDNLINISYIPLCSIASTFSFTYLLTHSPIFVIVTIIHHF